MTITVVIKASVILGTFKMSQTICVSAFPALLLTSLIKQADVSSTPEDKKQSGNPKGSIGLSSFPNNTAEIAIINKLTMLLDAELMLLDSMWRCSYEAVTISV